MKTLDLLYSFDLFFTDSGTFFIWNTILLGYWWCKYTIKLNLLRVVEGIKAQVSCCLTENKTEEKLSPLEGGGGGGLE